MLALSAGLVKPTCGQKTQSYHEDSSDGTGLYSKSMKVAALPYTTEQELPWGSLDQEEGEGKAAAQQEHSWLVSSGHFQSPFWKGFIGAYFFMMSTEVGCNLLFAAITGLKLGDPLASIQFSFPWCDI